MLRTMPNKSATVFAAVVVAQLLDLATFVPAVARVGIGAESNPLARTFYLSLGPMGPAALKVAGMTVILLALWRVMQRFPAYVLPSAALAAGFGLFGAVSNVLFGFIG